MPTEMKLPELGENVESGDVLRVLVKAGDRVKKDQAVLELETDKATIEVPSSAEGVIKDIKVKAGDKVKVGQTILVVEDGAGQKPEGQEQKEEAPKAAQAAPAAAPKPVPAPEPRRPGQVVDITRSQP